MAKTANANAKIVYNEDQTLGTTTTFVTVGEIEYGRKYDYPVVRLDDLTPEAQERVLPFTGGSREKADAIIEFAYRNRLAGAVAGKIRATLIAPSVKAMTTALRERCCDLIGEADMDGASALYVKIQESDHDELIELWKEHVQETVKIDFQRPKSQD